VWESTVGGRVLNFHLSGINNQNFIMRDEETGSWWQQVTGEAIFGPLKGQRLKAVLHDELTFATWKRERPAGRVLKPDERIAAAGEYAPANWEAGMSKVKVATSTKPDQRLEPRTLVIGVTLNGASKAYPFDALQKQSPIIDRIGSTPVLIVLGEDRKSVRAFERTIDGREAEFFAKPAASPLRLVDAATASEWDFTGAAISGQLNGQRLRQISLLEDYWFDWQGYHQDTLVYTLGER
jgi:hypothetical protein